MKKVYCKNCKYDDGLHFNKQGCGLTLIDAISGKLIQRGKNWWRRVELAKKLNSENNCSHYKRKWWKFWVK